jgi:hypothetical protein
MTEQSRIQPKTQRQAKPSHPVLWTGLSAGAMLIVVMLGSLVAANRVPALERYAFERNAACYALFVILMLFPVFRFLNRPLQMFASAMIGWVLFAGAYDLAALYFRNLFQVLRTPFEALIEGTIVYGIFAVGSWVVGMILHARRHRMAPVRRPVPDATHHIR